MILLALNAVDTLDLKCSSVFLLLLLFSWFKLNTLFVHFWLFFNLFFFFLFSEISLRFNFPFSFNVIDRCFLWFIILGLSFCKTVLFFFKPFFLSLLILLFSLLLLLFSLFSSLIFIFILLSFLLIIFK